MAPTLKEPSHASSQAFSGCISALPVQRGWKVATKNIICIFWHLYFFFHLTWLSRIFRCTWNFTHTFKDALKKWLKMYFFSSLILIIKGFTLVGTASQAGTIVFTVDERNTWACVRLFNQSQWTWNEPAALTCSPAGFLLLDDAVASGM